MAGSGVAATIVERIVQSAQSAVANLRVRSALNPMLWLVGIVTIASFGFAYLFRSSELLSLIFIGVGALPVVATTIGFFYLLVVAPEKLQSEDYQLRHETLQLIKQKGTSVEIEPSSLESIANPVARALGAGEGR